MNSLRVCYVCNTMNEGEHDCQVAAKLAANPVKLDAPFVALKATPTRSR